MSIRRYRGAAGASGPLLYLRDVAGVKIPSRWTVSWLSGRSQFELTDIQPNAQIPAARFARPAVQGAAAARTPASGNQ